MERSLIFIKEFFFFNTKDIITSGHSTFLYMKVTASKRGAIIQPPASAK